MKTGSTVVAWVKIATVLEATGADMEQVMKRVETTGVVSADGTLTARVPADIPPGEHRIVLEIRDEPLEADAQEGGWPVIHVSHWPAGLSLRREDLYDDWGR